MADFQRIRDGYEGGGRRFARRVVRKVLRGGSISPNVVTVCGTALAAVAAALTFRQMFLPALVVFVIGSSFDLLDGAIAKVTGRVSAFGGFLDSTLDRVSEGLMLGGLGLMFAKGDQMLPLAACFVAMAGSYLVSYTRAKAEAMGVACKGGLASRPERVVLMGIGLAVAPYAPVALEIVVYVLAVATALTVAQRVAHVKRVLPGGRKPLPVHPQTRSENDESERQPEAPPEHQLE